MQTIKKDESGIAHVGMVLLVVAVLGIVGVGYWRVSSSDKSQNRSVDTVSTEQTQTLPVDLQDIKTLDEVGAIAGVANDVTIIKFVLESNDGTYIYKVTMSNGKKLVLDASTGKILSEETTDVSEDDKIPSGVQITVSPAEAYKIAAQRSSSPIKSVEMEVEDKKVVYKIEFKDGSKIEINATGGTIVKSEIKNEPKQEKQEDHDEDKSDETEDHDNEDSDDSQDSEDHEEEDR